MFVKPKIKSTYELHTANDRVLVLCDEREDVVIPGPLFVKLAPLLDGTNSLSKILEQVGSTASSMQVFFALDQLAKRGITVEGEGQSDHPSAALLERFSGWSSETVERIENLSVSVQSVGGDFTDRLTSVFSSVGLNVTSDGCDFTVVATDDYLRPELEALNRDALANQRPWMLVKPVGKELWIGPILQPGTTGCWHCMAHRLRANRQVEGYLENKLGTEELLVTSRSWLPSTISLAASLTANEVIKWAHSPANTVVLGKINSFDLQSRQTQEHVLIKRPQCSSCGRALDVESARAKAPAFVSRIKKFTSDGGHRTKTPTETFERYKHHISSILGVVSELRPMYGPGIQLVPAYVAGHNFAMGVYNLIFLRETLRGTSGGKGVSDIQARVSGLCEAIERYSGNYDGDLAAERGTYADLAPKAIHPNECMGFSAEQFENRHVPHPVAPKSRCVMIPRPFDENREFDWTEVWSLTNEEVRLLPTAYCYYGHPDFAETLSVFPDSNGAASGNTLEEAFLQGFMELAERDAVAIWFYNRIRKPGVDMSSFKLPYLDALQDFYRTLGRDLWVIDISSDLPIPVFACVSRRTDNPIEDIILGFGAHFDPKIALLRAVTEVNQFLPSLLHRRPDGSTNYLFGDELAMHWWRTARLEENQYLAPDSERALIRADEIQNLSSNDLLDDVKTCVELCRERGMEVLMQDQTRPDIQLSVVKIFVPKMAHFWRRLGKKRLWNVPVEQGWLEQPNTPETCNPYTIFF